MTHDLNILQGSLYCLAVIVTGFLTVILIHALLSELRDYLIRLYDGDASRRIRGYIKERIEKNKDNRFIRFCMDCVAKLISIGKNIFRRVSQETRNVFIKIGVRKPTGIKIWKKKS